MKPFLYIFLSFFPLLLSAQRMVSDSVYGTKGEEIGIKMIHTIDKGYLLVAYTSFPIVARYFIKLDSNFNQVWHKTKAESGFSLWDIIETSDSGFLVVGGRLKKVDSANFTNYAFIQKLNSHCDTLWSVTYKKYSINQDFIKGAQLSNGDYIVKAYYTPSKKNLICLDNAGNFKWDLNLTGFTILPIQDSFILARNDFFRKYTNDGTLYIDKSLSLRHGVEQILTLKEGGYLLFGSGLGMSKVSPDGDTVWSKAYREVGVIAGDIKQTLDSGFLAVGTYQDDIYLLKTDKNGNRQWSYQLPRPFEVETAYGLALHCDSSITVFCDATHGYYGRKDLYMLTWDSMPYVFGPCTLKGTGIEDKSLQLSYLNIYPNPATEELQMEWEHLFSGTVEIYDALGRKLLTQHIQDQPKITLAIGTLSPGMYVLDLKSVKGERYSRCCFIKNN